MLDNNDWKLSNNLIIKLLKKYGFRDTDTFHHACVYYNLRIAKYVYGKDILQDKYNVRIFNYIIHAFYEACRHNNINNVIWLNSIVSGVPIILINSGLFKATCHNNAIKTIIWILNNYKLDQSEYFRGIKELIEQDNINLFSIVLPRINLTELYMDQIHRYAALYESKKIIK